MIHAAASLSECANLVRHICKITPAIDNRVQHQPDQLRGCLVGREVAAGAHCATHLNVQLSIAFDQAYVINSHVRG